jgi:hypothetical protein
VIYERPYCRMIDECEANTLELDDIAEAIQASIESANQLPKRRKVANPADGEWTPWNRDCPARSNEDTNKQDRRQYHRHHPPSAAANAKLLAAKRWISDDEIKLSRCGGRE